MNLSGTCANPEPSRYPCIVVSDTSWPAKTGDAKPEAVSVKLTEPVESVPVAVNGIVPPLMFGPVTAPMPAIVPTPVDTSTDSAKARVMMKSGPSADHDPLAGPMVFGGGGGAGGGGGGGASRGVGGCGSNS